MNALLTRLLLWQKFALLSIICVVLIFVPLGLYVSESNKSIDAAQQEARGLVPIKAVLKVIQLTQQHRGLSAMVFGGNEAAKERRIAKQQEVNQAFAVLDKIAADLGDAEVTEKWRQAKNDWPALTEKVSQGSISGKDSFAQHTDQIGRQMKLCEFLVDHFGLSLDPEFGSSNLVDATLMQAPMLTEILGRMRAKGSGMLAAKSAGVEERTQLATMAAGINDRYDAIGNSLAKAASTDSSLKAKLAGPQQASLAAGAKALQLAQEQVVKPEQLTFPSADYFAQFTEAIDSQIKLNDIALVELESVLNGRAAKLMTVKYALIAAVLTLLLVAALATYLIVRSVTVPLRNAMSIARQIASGDLAVAVDATSKDETGQLMQALKDMAASLIQTVGTVRNGSEAIATAAGEIASGNLDLSSRTEQQAGSLEETASAIEELTSTVKQNAENAVQANQLAVSTSGIATKGGEVMASVIETMGALNDSAKKIVDIIGVIDGIAFQTNILALNAAVEAARAGEQGRGFAVVAAEVRTLAQRSAVAAKEIKGLIDTSSQKTEAGSRLVSQAGATMDEIISSVARVTGILSEIANSSQEQASGIEQINSAITQMDNVTQQNAALVEQAAAAAQALQEQTQNLRQAVGVFNL